MKYGESLFDILYLLTAIILGIKILLENNNKLSRMMGISILILGIGDAFHLVPRILNYFINNDFSISLGIGKLITSITMTVFYIMMYYIYLNNYNVRENKAITKSIWILAITRIILCLFPQNGWITNDNSLIWGVLRNIPFVIIGIIMIVLFYNKKEKDSYFKNSWLYIALSFIFYIIVVVGASSIPILGMFMLPKTICYILIMISFYIRSSNEI